MLNRRIDRGVLPGERMEALESEGNRCCCRSALFFSIATMVAK